MTDKVMIAVCECCHAPIMFNEERQVWVHHENGDAVNCTRPDQAYPDDGTIRYEPKPK